VKYPNAQEKRTIERLSLNAYGELKEAFEKEWLKATIVN
jgi:hypothetical protein